MSIRFAPASGSRHDMSARVLAPRRTALLRLFAANDNAKDTEGRGGFDPLLIEALRHFARHGIDAAPRARAAACAALEEGSRAGFDRWVAITGLFDSRLARKMAKGVHTAQD